jgi:hypothetical protein
MELCGEDLTAPQADILEMWLAARRDDWSMTCYHYTTAPVAGAAGNRTQFFIVQGKGPAAKVSSLLSMRAPLVHHHPQCKTLEVWLAPPLDPLWDPVHFREAKHQAW